MKAAKKKQRLAKRIKDYEKTISRMSLEQRQGYHRPGSNKK